MVDGEIIIHGQVTVGAEASQLSFDQALEAGQLVSHCSACGHRECPDLTHWQRSSFDRALPLAALSYRLRCRCGGRQIGLEIWPVAPCLPRDAAALTYHWRA